MSLRSYIDDLKVVKVGPRLRQRLERWVAGEQRRVMIWRLRRFRKQLERDMHPESWTELDAPMAFLLSDVCGALDLRDEERVAVLGEEGERALGKFLSRRPMPVTLINERQAKALACVQEHGAINLSVYRQLCPDWCDETLRLDLADLVQREILAKNGRNRGTQYTLAT